MHLAGRVDAAPASVPATASNCAALGDYPVGPRDAASARSGLAIQPPRSPWRLAGNIIVAAYTGCGVPTAGTFSIQGQLAGTPGQTGDGSTVDMPCAASCLGPPLAAISGTGTFRQDGTHPRDPLYISVDAALTRTVSGIRSRTVLRGIMGYLDVAPAQHVRLTVLLPPGFSFLPASTVRAGVLPVPLVIYGWRGM
jgi:hypothetical protein